MSKKTAGALKNTGAQVGSVKRKLVALDDRLLAPVPVDFATMMVTADAVIHSIYQVRLPPTEGIPAEVEAALVGRFWYGPAHFKALVALVVRQFITMEVNAGHNPQDAVKFIEGQLKTVVERLPKGNAGGEVLG